MSYVRMRLGRPSRMVGGLSKNVIPAGGQRHNRYLVSRSLSPPLLLCISLYPSLPLSLSLSHVLHPSLFSASLSSSLSLALFSGNWGVFTFCIRSVYVWIRLATPSALADNTSRIRLTIAQTFVGLLSIRFLKFGQRLLTFLHRFLFPLFTIDTFA